MKRFILAGLSLAGALFAGAAAASATPLTRADFFVHNNTGFVLDVLSVTPVDQAYVESKDYIHPSSDPYVDLGLQPHSWIKVNMHGDSCVYNIVGWFEDGSYARKGEVDLCRTRSFTFDP